jgi:hypothetical protein
MSFAQTTISTGSIQGTVTDPTGAVVGRAKITIANKDTGHVIRLATTSSGVYASGALLPGNYLVRVGSEGFKTGELSVVVKVGVTLSGNVKLQVGQATQVVEVHDSETRVNTEQATIQGVLTKEQIETLPLNGRNFIDLAQLEPGIQIQDVTLTASRIGHAGISVGGRYSESTRVEVDGLDLSDGAGSSFANISTSSIEEFSISQSSLDMSSETTNSGAVDIVTRTGTNAAHGEAFDFFRDRSLAANFAGGHASPYQRHDFGGNLGAPIVKDKLFFFLNAERYKQDLGFPVNIPPPLDGVSGIAPEPLRETMLDGRLDYNAPRNVRLFFRFAYDNSKITGQFAPSWLITREEDTTPSYALGMDFNTGRFTHSIRFGYMKFQEPYRDEHGPAIYDPLPQVSLRLDFVQTGVDDFLPAALYQSFKESKYDGTRSFASHILRYGFSYNQMLGGGFINTDGLRPALSSAVFSRSIAFADDSCDPNFGTSQQSPVPLPCFPGGRNNPVNYPLEDIVLGNGQGFTSEIPAFGFPAGGSLDNRIQWYLGDTWKARPYLTLNYGVRYVRDTGITNGDLAPIPCSAINPAIFNPLPTCKGNLLDMFGTGLSARIRQPNKNFAPQLGFAWDVFRNGKTALRGGLGLFYGTSYAITSRSPLLPKGLFNFLADSSTGQSCASGQFQFPVRGGGIQIVTKTPPTPAHPNGLDIESQVCGRALGTVASDVAALQKAYQSAWAAAAPVSNPGFIGNTLNPTGLDAPDYRTSYSLQMNIGIQHEIRKGVVLSADYVRNLSLRYLIGVDVNHVGDSRYLNKTAAINAINATLQQCGVASIQASIGTICPSGQVVNNAGNPRALTIEDFAGNGLTSTTAFLGAPPSLFGLDTDHGAAFAGINPQVGLGIMNFPIGRAVYNALQVRLQQNSEHPLPYTKSMYLQFSYSLSRYASPLLSSQGDDQDGLPVAKDFRNPLVNSGPSAFDRTHQFSLGTTIDFLKPLRVGLIAHVYSPLSQSLTVPDRGRTADIFHTDFNGDGTTGDLLPGTRVGAFGRNIKTGDLTAVLEKYNSTVAGELTPAGQALVTAGLFTKTQLVALGAVADTVPVGPTSNRASIGWLKTVDLRISAPIKLKEGFVIEPSAAIFNVFNFVNYDIDPTVRLDGGLGGSPGQVNGTTNSIANRLPERAGQGPGIFSLGTARQAEFGLKITF